MSETTIPKLNLKALKQDIPKETIEEKDEAPSTSIKSNSSATPKMSFASIRKEETEKESVKEDIEDVAEKEEISVKETSEEIPVENTNEGSQSVTLEEQTPEKEQSSEEKPQEPKEVKFSNYESHFTKESTNFLNKFKKFKYAPKTRVGLIIGLISLTALSIGGLMFLIPEKHSPGIYKASIMEILGKNTISPQEVPVEQEITTEKEILPPPAEEVKNVVPEIPKNETPKDKLRQHLLKRYSE